LREIPSKDFVTEKYRDDRSNSQKNPEGNLTAAPRIFRTSSRRKRNKFIYRFGRAAVELMAAFFNLRERY
jgi:hypothetical protein